MTLGHKITLLLSFMGVVTFIVFFWSVTQMFLQVNNLQSIIAEDQFALKTAGERSLKTLKEKAGQMSAAMSYHFSKMAEKLQRIRTEEEVFNDSFLRHQNQHFDAVDNFMSQKKRTP